MPDDDEPRMVPVTATCHTPECGNAGHPIEVMVVEASPYVVCGACSQEIADLT